MKTKAALIATGDEITDGDVQNTTGPAIARELVEHGLQITEHRMVPDDEAAIQHTIEALLANNDYLFITGGLGPTSDDRTRFALAKALKKELMFDESNWDAIVERLTSFNLAIPEGNRQQALFPEGATVLTNIHGTAAGCHVEHNGKHIFMLPGPPHECLPMFHEYIIPQLPLGQQHKLHWMLMGVGEGDVAERMDKALADMPCRTGYRAAYPYLECKVWADDDATLKQCANIIEPLLQPNIVNKEHLMASEQLKQQLLASDKTLNIYDAATGGLLKATLLSPKTKHCLNFSSQATDINITGLDAYWLQEDIGSQTSVTIEINGELTVKEMIYRGKHNRDFVVEWGCWQILQQMF
tara:strand:- start:17567 stop:18631 length:1065 start_codon:yes stop_codon:yes gene_type:complete